MTTEGSTPRPVEDIGALVQLVELKAVVTFGLSAVREESEVTAPEQELAYMHRVSAEQLESRFQLAVRTPDAKLNADIAVRYDFDEPLAPTEGVLLEFAERVGVMAAFPFLREAIFTLAARLGVDAPVIGLLKAGEVHFGAAGASETAPADSEPTPSATRPRRPRASASTEAKGA